MSRPIATLFGGFGRIGITDMDCPLATHVHPHLHAIIKLAGADTSFQVRDALCPVTADSAVLVNAWEPHAWTFRRERGPTRFLTLYLDPKWLSQAGLTLLSSFHICLPASMLTYLLPGLFPFAGNSALLI